MHLNIYLQLQPNAQSIPFEDLNNTTITVFILNIDLPSLQDIIDYRTTVLHSPNTPGILLTNKTENYTGIEKHYFLHIADFRKISGIDIVLLKEIPVSTDNIIDGTITFI